MLSPDTIASLNSSNICNVEGQIKKFMDEYWKNASTAIKNRAVQLGKYENTKAFNTCKATNRISVRMTIALALTFNISPDYIIGKSEEPGKCTDEIVAKFLDEWGFSYINNTQSEEAKVDVDSQQKQSELSTTLINLLKSKEVDEEELSLTKDEAKVLLDALYIKNEKRVKEAEDKLKIIQFILTHL